MFGKLFAGIVAAGVLAGALATGALAAPAAAPSASPIAKHRAVGKDVVRGTVTAISDAQLTVRDRAGASKTLLRTDQTQVFRGKARASWSEIEVNSQVAVHFQERDGKLYAMRIRIGRAHLAGKVEGVSGNIITIRGRDGKDVKVTVSAETTYFEAQGKGHRKPASLGDIHAGQRLIAAGSWDKSGAFDALTVLFWDKGRR